MAEIEQMVGNAARANELAGYARDLKAGYNAAFWNDNHYIQVIDEYGAAHDYGCVYLNLEAINYGLASETQAVAIMDFLSNENVVWFRRCIYGISICTKSYNVQQCT